ncbi:T9SS type A sorting domain-containing protein [Flavobacterium sp.]|uniref:T9SS type A sorting domain-containing protein n=1 Tax=Flavobacterium sp. TaxID=239 RepID=UPI00262E5D77|nr:T9SS type A sorting domain-containing protein [Flavobacterium sp.]
MLKKIVLTVITALLFCVSSSAQSISVIGDAASGWGTDVAMSTTDNVNYTLSNFTFTTGGLKFRQDSSWANNWGANSFPNGTAAPNGSNIPVTAGVYDVMFNRTTRVYSFTPASTGFGIVNISGSAGPGAGVNVAMSTVDGINYALDSYTLTAGTIQFVQSSSPITTWGSSNFPTGTATINAPSIVVTPGTYDIRFNKVTGAFSFTFPTIGIIGSSTPNGWTSDTLLTTTDGVNYSRSDVSLVAGEIKFRQGQSWAINWGGSAFPNGTATLNGNNISVVPGIYQINFNRITGVYSFNAGFPVISLFTSGGTDIELTTLDGVTYYLNNYTINSGSYRFRQSYSNTTTWGSASFPTGTGTNSGSDIPVIGGDYNISFNRTTGAYSFQYLSIGVIGSSTPGGWSSDTFMSTTNGVDYTLSGLNLTVGELKFRQGADWGTNWGGNSFPGGVANLNGSNIGVTSASTFTAHFNRTTGQYYFYDQVNLQTSSPVNLCRYSTAPDLATLVQEVPGSVLKWYTAATGGTASLTTPTISTSSLTTRTFYVSQTIGGIEGPRVALVVNVVGAPAMPGSIVAKHNNITVSSSAFGNFVGTTLPVEFSIVPVANATSYEWTLPSGATIVSGASTHVVVVNLFGCNTTAGTMPLSVRAISSAGCASAARTYTATKAIPGTPGTITASSANVCSFVGTTTSVSYSTTNVLGVVYNWSVPAGATIVSGQGTHSINVNYSNEFTASGQVIVAASNSVGSAALTRMLTVTRRLPSTPAMPIGQFYAICPSSGAYTYTLASAPAFATSWTITGPAGSVVKSPNNLSNTTNTITTSTDLTFTVLYPSSLVSGVGAITIQSSNGCAQSSVRSSRVYRVFAPSSSITGPSEISCASLGSSISYSCATVPGASTYTWSFYNIPGATIVSGQGTTNVVVNYPVSLASVLLGSTASIRVVASGTACGAAMAGSTRTLAITKPICGSARAEAGGTFSELYPNPVSDRFYMDILSDRNGEISLQIFAYTGNRVVSNTYQLVEGKNTISTDVSALPRGIYIVKIYNENQTEMTTKKLIKN